MNQNLKCVICNKSFSRKDKLKVHEQTKKHKINSGELKTTTNVYECVKCDYTSIRKYNLNAHMKSNHIEKKDTHLEKKEIKYIIKITLTKTEDNCHFHIQSKINEDDTTDNIITVLFNDNKMININNVFELNDFNYEYAVKIENADADNFHIHIHLFKFQNTMDNVVIKTENPINEIVQEENIIDELLELVNNGIISEKEYNELKKRKTEEVIIEKEEEEVIIENSIDTNLNENEKEDNIIIKNEEDNNEIIIQNVVINDNEKIEDDDEEEEEETANYEIKETDKNYEHKDNRSIEDDEEYARRYGPKDNVFDELIKMCSNANAHVYSNGKWKMNTVNDIKDDVQINTNIDNEKIEDDDEDDNNEIINEDESLINKHNKYADTLDYGVNVSNNVLNEKIEDDDEDEKIEDDDDDEINENDVETKEEVKEEKESDNDNDNNETRDQLAIKMVGLRGKTSKINKQINEEKNIQRKTILQKQLNKTNLELDAVSAKFNKLDKMRNVKTNIDVLPTKRNQIDINKLYNTMKEMNNKTFRRC